MWTQALIAICILTLAVTATIGLLFAWMMARLRWLGPESPRGRKARVSAIVPARNEEGDIERSLRSLLAQEGVDIEVIAVNDHSSDRTGGIIDAIAREDSRLRAIHDPPLPDGWLGKTNAMQRGAALASGDFLLFTDADTIHAPASIAAALGEMERCGLDFISLLPRFRCESLIENVLIPGYIGGFVRLGTPGLRTTEPGGGLAAGAFLFVKAEVFRAEGGFEPLRAETLDDVELSRRLKKIGRRVGFRIAPELLEVRLFKGNRDAFWGTTKNVLAVIGSNWLAAGALLANFLLLWAPPIAIIAGAAGGDRPLLALGAAAYALQYLIVLPGLRIFRFRPLKMLAFPLTAVVTACCLGRALYYRRVRGSVLWRGREVAVPSRADLEERGPA